jgi:hypothetical protein
MTRTRVSFNKKYVFMHSNEYNSESTATGAVEMMAENSLTFLPLDDPKKEVSLFYLQYYYIFFQILYC